MPDQPIYDEISQGLADAIANAKIENYLGDVQVVDAILRMFVKSCLDRHFELDVKKAAVDGDGEDALRMAEIFLGRDKNYQAMPGWNTPGMIDQFLARELNVKGTPEEVVAILFLDLLIDIYELYAYAAIPETKDEQWQWQVQAIIERYVWLLLGIPDAVSSLA